jgi:hypothetical protein
MSFKNIDFALLFLLLLRNTGNQLPMPPASATRHRLKKKQNGG